MTGRVNEFFAALRKGDAAALGPFYADNYTLTLETGAVMTKAQRLEWLKINAPSLASIETSDLKVRAYGDDAAVVTGHVTIKGDGAAENEWFMQVWVKQGDVWRMVAGRITAIAPAQPATQPTERKPSRAAARHTQSYGEVVSGGAIRSGFNDKWKEERAWPEQSWW